MDSLSTVCNIWGCVWIFPLVMLRSWQATWLSIHALSQETVVQLQVAHFTRAVFMMQKKHQKQNKVLKKNNQTSDWNWKLKPLLGALLGACKKALLSHLVILHLWQVEMFSHKCLKTWLKMLWKVCLWCTFQTYQYLKFFFFYLLSRLIYIGCVVKKCWEKILSFNQVFILNFWCCHLWGLLLTVKKTHLDATEGGIQMSPSFGCHLPNEGESLMLQYGFI